MIYSIFKAEDRIYQTYTIEAMNYIQRISLAITLIICIFLGNTANAQYDFEIKNQLKCTEIKNQAKTGTCWSFASSSFMESELMRMGKGEHNLSEMFVVRNIYKDKARNYLLRQGKANFIQGS